MAAINPWDGSTGWASACAMVAHICIRHGDLLAAQEIADQVRSETGMLGSCHAAEIIEFEIAAKRAEPARPERKAVA